MSEENVEVARRSVEALRRRDRTAFLAVHDADFEVVPIRDWPEPGVRGAEAVWDFYLQTFDAFEQFPIEGVEIIDGADDKVLFHYRVDLSGRESGADVRFDYWLVSTFRGKKVVHDHWFTDRAEALEAAGLRE